MKEGWEEGIFGKRIPGGGNSKYKGPEVVPSMFEPQQGGLGGWGRVTQVTDEGREVMQQIRWGFAGR